MMALGHLRRGQHFIGAAVLLREKGGDEYVVLHVLCQGIEIVLKAVLLLRDFDRYQPRLVRYRHNLLDLASDALAEYKLHPLRAPVWDEFKELDRLYSHHILRYGLLLHSLVDPTSIPHMHVFRRILAVVRLVTREAKSL
jgi:hypothetical protein